MSHTKRCIEIANDILSIAYAKAIPEADYYAILSSCECHKQRWFMKYYLSMDELNKIIDDYFINNNIPNKYKRFVKHGVYDLSPNSCKETWREITGDKRVGDKNL